MTPSRTRPRTYFTTPPVHLAQAQPLTPAISPRLRSFAMACTACAMLGTVGVLASVAMLSGRDAAAEREIAVATAAETIRASVPAEERATVTVLAAPTVETADDDAADETVPVLSETPDQIPSEDGRWAREVPDGATPAFAAMVHGLNAYARAGRPSSPAKDAWSAIKDGQKPRETPRVDEARKPTASEAATAALTPVEKVVEQAISGSVPTGSGTLRTAANLRSAPRNGSTVLGAIPARETVRVVSCDIWCEVEHGGRRGFVVAKFVQRGPAAAEAKAPAPAAVAPERAREPVAPIAGIRNVDRSGR